MNASQEWDGVRFIKKPLRHLGLRYQIGHEDGSPCLVPLAAHERFTLVHHNALHEVALDFCGCPQSQPSRIQLLRAGLFPATLRRPRTAVSFECLDEFHALTLTGKLSAYDYYKHLVYRTDALGLNVPKVRRFLCYFLFRVLRLLQDRYKAFLRVVRQFRHLTLLMRGGKGCEDDGANNVGVGELALACPACPRPAINLPANWRDAKPEDA